MMTHTKRYSSALIVLTSVFFFWGFVAASNDILIPVFKEKLNLTQGEAQLISLAFYIAYTVGSLIYLAISKLLKTDILNKMGYKNGIALGLLISASGTLLFVPAASYSSFGLMITGLFTIGIGFSLQQTAANPLMIALGDPAKGSQRLSLGGGVNNLGTTIGPLLLSYAIFGALGSTLVSPGIESVKIPYLILGAAFVVVALVIKFSSVPNKLQDTAIKIDQSDEQVQQNIFTYPQLLLGMLAIFVYVGVEVSTASNLPEFMKQHLGVTTDKIAPYVSLFWASLMIGRWTSSVGAFDLKKPVKVVLSFLMPYIAFAVYLLVNKIAGNDVSHTYIYAAVILLLIIGDILSKGNPAKQLLIYSFLGIAALFVGILSDGLVSVFAFSSVGLFCSTLWPCIFTLAIAGLGKYTNQGSGFLIMMIMGGGIISWIQGTLASNDKLGIQWSYLVGVICFAYLAFYAWKVKHILKKQGIDFSEKLPH